MLQQKYNVSDWLIFLTRYALESGLSLALFLIVGIRTRNSTEGMQSS